MSGCSSVLLSLWINLQFPLIIYLFIGLVYRTSVVPISNFLEPKMMSWNALLIIFIDYTLQMDLLNCHLWHKGTGECFHQEANPMEVFVPNRCYENIFPVSAEVNSVQECLSAFGLLLRTCWQLLRSCAPWMRKLIESINQVSELLPINLRRLLTCVTTPFY